MSVVTTVRDRLKDSFVESIYDNPIVARECRTRLRGIKGFGAMGGYVLLVGAVLFIAYIIMSGYVQSIMNQHLGKDLFQVLMWTQTILLALLMPSLASGMLTQEIEKKTIELLVLTRLSPGKIALGKQFSAFLFSLILIICSLPLSGICLMLGGISPIEILVTYLLLMAWTFLFSCAGVFWSSLFNRTATAGLLAFITCTGYTVNSAAMGVTIPASSYGGGSGDCLALAALNPAWAAFDAFAKAPVCGLHIPVALVAFLLNTATGILLLLVASTHIRFHKLNRALPIRLLLLAITGSLVWLVMGNGVRFSFYSSGATEALVVASTFILSVLMAGAGIFATGEVKSKPTGSLLAGTLSFKKLFSNSIYGGIPFMLTWGLLLMLILGFTAFVAAGLSTGSAPYSSGTHMSWGHSGSSGSPDFGFAFFQLCFTVLTIIFGTSCIGFLLSTVVPARIGAAALLMVFVVFAFSGYGIILSCYQFSNQQSSAPIWQLAAFWPMTPFMTIGNAWTSSGSMPKLWWNPSDSWLVTGFTYIIMGAIALLIATTAISKRKLKEE